MGSASLPGVQERARAATAEYDSLVTRVGGISSDAGRVAITDWIGSWNIPGTPAERYQAVLSDLKDSQPDPVLQAKRVTDLENVLQEFRAKVANAEAVSGPVTAADQGQVADASGQLTPKGVAMGAIAIIGFFVLPFVMD